MPKKPRGDLKVSDTTQEAPDGSAISKPLWVLVAVPMVMVVDFIYELAYYAKRTFGIFVPNFAQPCDGCKGKGEVKYARGYAHECFDCHGTGRKH